jgi:hypothetical protein
MRSIIEAAWENRELLNKSETIQAIEQVIEEIDKGLLRVAEPGENGEWIVIELNLGEQSFWSISRRYNLDTCRKNCPTPILWHAFKIQK